MKSVVKKALIVFAVILIALICAAAYFLYPLFTMTPAETGYIEDTGIFAIKNNHTTVYLIKTGEGYIMIDAGANVDSLRKSLAEAGIGTDEVGFVFITHSHEDHIAGWQLFSNAVVCQNEDGFLVEGARPLKDDEELILGGHTVKCIKAPGHTGGSMVYLVDDKYLFTGDAVKLSEGEMEVHPFTSDKSRAAISIIVIKEIAKSCEMVLTAHYGYADEKR